MKAETDLVVIGAGINGAAIAREAALLGLDVLLLDAADIVSGTSAASTRLIHGGLRYLEYGELNLVYESLGDRERLLRTAPHLVTPLEFFLPVYRGSKRPKWQIRAGMLLYDLLSLGKSLPSHTMLSAKELRQRLPGISEAGLVGGASYYDAQLTFPERLVVENVIDAVGAGASIRTYTKVTEIVIEDRRVRGVRWQDADGKTGTVYCRCVINAAGPWVDRVIAGIGKKRLIGGTRGSHLVVEPFEGAPRGAVYTEAASDGRPFFIVPWNGMCLIGTTDERFDGDPREVAITDSEFDYLVSETENTFPSAGGIAGRVCYTHAGIRPLPYTPKGAEGAITRRHLIRHHRNARGLYSIVGGKLTTHRALAVDVMKRLRRRLDVPRGSRTGERMLPGGLAAPEREELVTELTAELGAAQAVRLWRIYGAGARTIYKLARETPELSMVVSPASSMLVAEIVHALDAEWARTLTDILQRRSMTGLGPDFGLQSAGPVADWLVRLGRWDRARAQAEVEAYRRYARRFRAAGRLPPIASRG